MTIARNMTLFVLLSSLTMLAAAVGCGERSSTGPEPEAAALPASSGEQDQDEGKTEEAQAPIEVGEPTVAEPEPTEPEPEGPQLGARDGLAVERLVIARNVVDREPEGASTRFEGGEGRIYAFVEAASSREEESTLHVTFEGPTRTVGHVALTIPADVPRWRTWAYSRLIDESGEWEAVVRTTEGEVLGRTSFHVD